MKTSLPSLNEAQPGQVGLGFLASGSHLGLAHLLHYTAVEIQIGDGHCMLVHDKSPAPAAILAGAVDGIAAAVALETNLVAAVVVALPSCFASVWPSFVPSEIELEYQHHCLVVAAAVLVALVHSVKKWTSGVEGSVV